MTTDMVGLERAVFVMAICMAIQTLLFMGAAIAGFVAWRRANEAMAEARAAAESQVAELRVYLDRMSSNVDQASRALLRGTNEVSEVVSDVRGAMGSVRDGVGTVASVMTGRRAALAVGLWRGIQMWRKRRANGRMAAAASQA
jgi:hypothetical protein